jgi:DNA-binding LacI/PurR family transcriptional regulator
MVIVMATIDDVAKRAGVSKSSVSRVLNGNFEYMSAHMKQKILDVIVELNYSPNSLAQSLKKKKTSVIGIILSDIANPFWSEVLKGVQEECNRSGYGLMVSFNGTPESEKDTILMLRNRQVDGLIVNTAGSNPALFEGMLEEEFSFVMLDRSLGGMKVDTVVVNNVEGSKQAVQYLIDQGHRRIGILLHPLGNVSPRIERLEGYKQALLTNGLLVDDSLIKICDSSRGSGLKAVNELLSMPNRPTGFFTTNVSLNLEAISGIKSYGLRIPSDVSLIGYDDFPWIPLLDPPLSTVSQPAFEMGVKAAALLIHNIKKKRRNKPQTLQLQPQLVIRESCCPPLSLFEGGDSHR